MNKFLEIIQKNGGGFNLKVSEYLKSLGWNTAPSKYYTDPITGKPRELDIVATKKFSIADSGKSLVVRLFIECKKVPHENVVWFTERNEGKIKELIFTNPTMRIAEDKHFHTVHKHHYLKGERVAIFSGRDGHDDLFYTGWSNCLHGMISLGKQDYDHYRLDYPIIVLDSFDNIHTPTDDDNNPSVKIENNFQFGVDYSYKDKNGIIDNYFLVDVASFDLLGNLLMEIEENDVKIAESLALGEIKEQIFNERFNRDRNDDSFGFG